MSDAERGGPGPVRVPRAYDDEMPRRSILALLATWVMLAQGALTLAFTPLLVFTSEVDVPPGDIAAFAGLGAGCLAAGVLLSTRWKPAWWVGLATTIGTAGWLISDRGLTSWAEVYVGVGLTVAAVLLLVLGRGAAGRPEALALASANIPFRAKLAAVWVVIFAGLTLFLLLVDLDVAWMRENYTYILKGLVFTVFLALGAIVLATILALLGALGRLSSNPVAFGLSGFYTSFFRGTPLIVQLFLIYNALPQIGQSLDRLSLINILALSAFQAGVIGLGLNYGAYMTEIFRAGIQSVGHGQAEAADALGMTYGQRMRRIVLPQATRVIIPPAGNEFIAMMKDTALISFLGVEVAKLEVFKRAQLAGGQDLRRLESLLIAAGVYWTLTAIFTFFQAKLERRLSRGYVRVEARLATGRKRPQFLPGGPAGGAAITPEGADTEGET